MKRTIAMFLALALVFTACAAAEGGLSALVSAADRLAFSTENVTLKAEAKFHYDGQWFKTFHGEYRQDGYNSFMNVMLDTPRADGSVYSGGYTVVGNDYIAYFNDTCKGNYYLSVSCEPNNTVLKKSAALGALSGVAQSAASLVSGLTADAVALNGNTVTVKWQNAPALVNSALTLMAVSLMENQNLTWAMDASPSIYYEDYEAFVRCIYEELFSKKMPDDFYYTMDENEEAFEAKMAVESTIYQRISVLSRDHAGGVLYIHNDGSADWYKNEDAYLLANGIVYLQYDSYFDSLSAFHAEKYGKPFDETMFDTLFYSNNGELWDAYIALEDEMDEKYNAIQPKNADTVALIIHADGSFDESNQGMNSIGYYTVTRDIVSTFASLSIANVDAVSTLDEGGNILTAKGTASFTVTDKNGDTHDLTVEFDCTADDYGTTHVGSFVPEEYGFISFDEFSAQLDESYAQEYTDDFDYEKFIESLMDKTVELAGKTYPAMLETDEIAD